MSVRVPYVVLFLGWVGLVWALPPTRYHVVRHSRCCAGLPPPSPDDLLPVPLCDPASVVLDIEAGANAEERCAAERDRLQMLHRRNFPAGTPLPPSCAPSSDVIRRSGDADDPAAYAITPPAG